MNATGYASKAPVALLDVFGVSAEDAARCLDENTIDCLVSEQLTVQQQARVRAHTERCSDCRALVAAVHEAAGVAATYAASATSGASAKLIACGQTLAGRYRVGSLIGAGGMGQVYEGLHVQLERRVAIKVLHQQMRDHPDAFARFRREAKLCGELGSEHIVEVLDFDISDDGTPFMVMELLEGGDLAQLLESRAVLSISAVIDVAKQICAALIAAHREGVFHRDLKPSNVFLCGGAFNRVKVLDFGICKARGTLATVTASREILGTPYYMSPEMASAQHQEVDGRSDLFSLGTILYEALVGKRPFDGEAIPAVLYRVVHEDPPAPYRLDATIPRWLSDLVMALLAKQAVDRPQSASAVLDALNSRRFAGGRRRRAAKGWLLVAGAAAVAATAYFGYGAYTAQRIRQSEALAPTPVAVQPLGSRQGTPPELPSSKTAHSDRSARAPAAVSTSQSPRHRRVRPPAPDVASPAKAAKRKPASPPSVLDTDPIL
ncbi:MAG: protein kinase [Deltaproteobacteria bacterium]|nr:protein kinase [Deltaproteobacteria bacterium]